jgi:hypothetical protein
VSELLAANEKPQPQRLDEQIFDRAKQTWEKVNPDISFPDIAFFEYCYAQRKDDSSRVDDARFGEVASALAHERILLPRTETTKEGDHRYYVFRHERLANYFIYLAFAAPNQKQRRTEEAIDTRFRSVYLMIAERADLQVSQETLGLLHDQAQATKDFTLYAEYYRRFKARPDVSEVVIIAEAAE